MIEVLIRAESMRRFAHGETFKYGDWRAWFKSGGHFPNYKILSYGHSGPVPGKLHIKLCGPDQ